MEIEVDYNPFPQKSFFISVGLNEKEAISFDYTIKGQRVIKQVLIGKKPFPKDRKPTSEWDTIVINNRKFIKKYHVKWIDMGKKDWVNDEIWECVWEKPLSKNLTKRLLIYSQLFSDNYKQLSKFSKDLEEFEKLLQKEIKKTT